MLLEAPTVKPGKISEVQRFARKRPRPGGRFGWTGLLFGKLELPSVERLELGDLCIEDDRALVERAQKEGRL